MIRRTFTLLLLVATSFLTDPAGTEPATKPNDFPQEVDLCEVLRDPAAFNNKLLQLTGFGSHGFEDSSFWSPTCDSAKASIWMEYGGKRATGTTYCCGVPATRSRQEDPEVEGFTIPLVEDDKFQKFDNLLRRANGSIARATLVGRFFAGTPFEKTGRWMGFGHMGCCSLFVIQQVLSVEREDDDLDQSSNHNEYDFLERFSSFRYMEIPRGMELINLQKKAESAEASWRFTDHRRVVTEQLENLPSFERKSLSRLRIAKQSHSRIVYTLKDRKKQYLAVAVRPYWLSFYAKNRKNVIWTIGSLVVSPYDSSGAR